jgi:hypothetical protein
MSMFWERAFGRGEPPGPVDIYAVLRDPDHPVFPDLGRLLWSLVTTQQEWVYRRVETATLVAERRIRRQMSVDCRIPPEVTSLAGALGLDRFPVPLRFVMRQSLLNFDLTFDRRPVPLLTRSQNIMATRALLQAAVENCDLGMDDRLLAVLADVARADVEARHVAFDHLGVPEKPVADEPVELAMLRWGLTTFDRNYVLLADVPLERIRDRAVFKITQEFPQHLVESTDPAEEEGPSRHRLSFAQQIAWQPVSFRFDTPDITAAASYHFEFVAPQGLTVAGGALAAATPETREQGGPPRTFGTPTVHSSMLGLNAHADEVPEDARHYAVVRVRPATEGLLRAGAASAVITTCLLAIAAVWSHRLDQSSVGPSVTLLLVIPGLVSTFLVRPGEHSMVSWVLRGVRTLILATGVLTYLAAGLLAVGVTGGWLRLGWFLVAGLSACMAVPLVVAVRRCHTPLVEAAARPQPARRLDIAAPAEATLPPDPGQR